MEKTIYYTDELNDDFGTTIKPDKIKPLPQNYKFISRNVFVRAFEWVVYNIFAKPLAFLYVKIKFKQKFVGKKALKTVKGGYFIYANHTLDAGDTFIPNIARFSKRNYILSGGQANSLTSMLPILRAVGSIPVNGNLRQSIEMGKCIRKRIEQGASVTVYPEAHVWPYYTGIRPFSDKSFKYPVVNKAPVFCITNCFVRRKHGKRPKVLSFVDGPFYPRDDLSVGDNAKYLRDTVYGCMKDRTSHYSTYAYYNYLKHYDVRITAVKKANYPDLSSEYENPIECPCDIEEGTTFVSVNCTKPEGLCDSAWETMLPFVKTLSEGGGDFFDGWMKNKYSAMISCNDGFRPVSFLLEAIRLNDEAP